MIHMYHKFDSLFFFFFFLMRILNQMRMFWLIDWLIDFGCVGSSFLCEGFLQLWQAGATPHRDARASHRRGLSRCGAQAPDAQAQQPWLTGPAAPRHVGSSQARARTRVPCISRQTPNHCATREAPILQFLIKCLFFQNKMIQFVVDSLHLTDLGSKLRIMLQRENYFLKTLVLIVWVTLLPYTWLIAFVL